MAGGIVGNQFGRGGGHTAMTLLGALGGGLAGNSVEKHLRSETDYSVRVRMENGHTRYFTYKNPPPFAQGQRVYKFRTACLSRVDRSGVKAKRRQTFRLPPFFSRVRR
ncbi:MAG: Outer membrane lipoprotein [uncultured Caballeronia sp.]|nr:MAG: Outer membrane lipoprotein [uncultured Caballeronia sp.]